MQHSLFVLLFRGIISAEVDAAVNGKQWMLSCFGPFKESKIMPNFTQDQSFDEVRLGFFDSTKSGNAQEFVRNLNAEYSAALQRFVGLKNLSADMLQLVVNIYNTSTESKGAKAQVQLQQNQQKSNPFQSTNMFTDSQQSAAMNSSSIFGNSSNTTNPFQSQKPSVFGQITTTASQQTPQPSLFAMAMTQQDKSTSSPASSMFGQSIFATASNQSQQQQLPTQQTPSIFGGGGGNSSNIFTAAANPALTNIIQSPSLFAQPTPIDFSVFTSPSSTPSTNIFQQALNTSQAAMPTTNIFGAQSVQQPPIPQQTTTTNIFGAQNVQQLPAPQQITTTSVFQISSQSAPGFGSNQGGDPFQRTPLAVINDDSFYSKPEDLTTADIGAFQADHFECGKVPTTPPTRDLCL
jgi:nucleoporin-like protein 2